mmetsp:Transcript_4289/g.13718  ORF Transcript_4289/g.13718 Transcript_4289/m.13718 type:complete len:322 (-) Transcript_4289:1556-2521(-)
MPWMTMCFHMVLLMRGSSLPLGFSSSKSGVGSSVASASAAMESMMRFTQSSCSTLSGVPLPVMAAITARVSATRLMVSWNCRNLRMLQNTERPHSTLLTIELKLSSRITMSLASLATSVPAMPMASPTWDSLSAGASLVPSPVTATISPAALSICTRWYLSLGEERASTCKRGSRGASSSGDILRNTGPSIAMPSVMMPHSRAMCSAVCTLSPVTMRTVMPAPLQALTASGTSGRRGSLMPTTAMSVRSSSGGAASRSMPATATSLRSRYVMASVRRPLVAIAVMRSATAAFSAFERERLSPPSAIWAVQRSSTISAAPLQ